MSCKKVIRFSQQSLSFPYIDRFPSERRAHLQFSGSQFQPAFPVLRINSFLVEPEDPDPVLNLPREESAEPIEHEHSDGPGLKGNGIAGKTRLQNLNKKEFVQDPGGGHGGHS